MGFNFHVSWDVEWDGFSGCFVDANWGVFFMASVRMVRLWLMMIRFKHYQPMMFRC